MSAAKRGYLHPRWLRPATLALVFSAHVSVLLLFRATVEPPPSLESFQVDLIPEGDSAADQTPQAEVKPEVKPEVEPLETKPQAEAPAPPLAPLAAPPPQQQAPEAPPLPEAPPKPVEKPPKPSPEARRDLRRNKQAEARRREDQEKRREEARQEAHRGAANGARRASGMSQANFAGLIVAQLNRHKFYPAAARAQGISGSVGVTFTIGPSGRVVSQSVTRSSGSDVLDSAARVILSAIQTPPPPGGHFSTRTNINFQSR